MFRIAHRLRHRYRSWRKIPLAGCSVIVTDLHGAILLIRHSYGPSVWCLPGGGMDRGESPEQAARREVEEETGIRLGKLTSFGVIEEQVSGSPHTAHLFAGIADSRPVADGREVVEARFFPPHSLPEPLSGFTRSRLAIWRARKLEQR